jgi:hypothetical protein
MRREGLGSRDLAMPRYRQFPKSDDLDPRGTRPHAPISTTKLWVALALVAIVGLVAWLWAGTPIT